MTSRDLVSCSDYDDSGRAIRRHAQRCLVVDPTNLEPKIERLFCGLRRPVSSSDILSIKGQHEPERQCTAIM